MSSSTPRTLRFAVGGALLALSGAGAPIDQGCISSVDVAEAEAFDASTAPPPPSNADRRPTDHGPIVVNPGPIAPPLPATAKQP